MSGPLGRCGGLAICGQKPCPHASVESLGGVPLCQLHHWKVLKEAMSRSPVGQAAVDSAVYYLGDPETQLVKIGVSTKLASRFATLRRNQPKLLLLATEPGTMILERDRHRQFAELRARLPNGEREWFRKNPDLMAHIGRIRLKHGILSSDQEIFPGWIAPLFGQEQK